MSAIPGRPFAGPEKPPSKRTELAQAQAKIDAAQEEVRQRRIARDAKRRDMDSRMQAIASGDSLVAAADA